MGAWNPADRVEHQTYGPGTVIECNEQHTVVHFDDHGRRTFATSQVVLTDTQRVAPHTVHRTSGKTSERTTDVGYENLNRQRVIRHANVPGDRPGERVYVLKCSRCGAEYGAIGSDIHLRRCLACMGGPPGVAI